MSQQSNHENSKKDLIYYFHDQIQRVSAVSLDESLHHMSCVWSALARLRSFTRKICATYEFVCHHDGSVTNHSTDAQVSNSASRDSRPETHVVCKHNPTLHMNEKSFNLSQHLFRILPVLTVVV